MSHKVQPRAFTTKPRHNHLHWVNPPTSPCPTLSAAQLPEVTLPTWRSHDANGLLAAITKLAALLLTIPTLPVLPLLHGVTHYYDLVLRVTIILTKVARYLFWRISILLRIYLVSSISPEWGLYLGPGKWQSSQCMTLQVREALAKYTYTTLSVLSVDSCSSYRQ